MTNNLAKSPSLEFGTNGALLSDESGSDWRAREAVLGHLNKAEKDSILRVPAAKNPEDLKLFLRWVGNGEKFRVLYGASIIKV